MLDFGATFLPDPPVQTFVDRVVRAEELGFRYALDVRLAHPLGGGLHLPRAGRRGDLDGSSSAIA